MSDHGASASKRQKITKDNDGAAGGSSTKHGPESSTVLSLLPQESSHASIPPPGSPRSANSASLTSGQITAQGEAAQDAADAPLQAENGITVDTYSDQDHFSDDGYDTDMYPSISTSLASSMYHYNYENGRRYHKFREGRYNFPNDDSEQDREDLKHACIVQLCQAWYLAPIEKMQTVLDMGTGTGIWAIDMGDQHPSASILGVDLSPIQPEWVPPNVKFMVDDVESPWIHPPNHFDLIHSRHMITAIKDWPTLLDNCYQHLKPGGWLELQEIHHFPQSESGAPLVATQPLVEFWSLIAEALNNLDIDFKRAPLLHQVARDAGFVNVTERVFHLPIGTWAKNRTLKECGLMWKTVLLEGLSPIALAPFTRGLGWSQVEVEAFLVSVRQCLKDGPENAFMPLHIICAQRPVDDL